VRRLRLPQINLDPSKEKLVIELTEDDPPAPSETPAEEPLGMLPTPHYRRHTYRRPEDEEGVETDPNIYVRIFDGGILASGADIAWSFNNPPELVLTPIMDGHTRFAVGLPDYTESFNSYMVAIGSPEGFFPILPDVITRYGASVLGALGSYNPERGYVWLGGANVSSIGGTAFRRFATNDPARFKITKLPSFDSPEEPLSITGDFDLIQMPTAYRYYGEAYQYDSDDTGISPGKFDLLSGYISILKRSQALINPTFEALYGDTMFKRTVTDVAYSPSPPRPVAERDFFYNFFTTQAEASMYRVEAFLAFFQKWYISHTSVAPGSFKRHGDPRLFSDIGYSIDYPRVFLIDAGFKPELLLAMIRHAGEMYYVWSRADFPLFSVSIRFNVRV
jgi:hypothetical protein